MYAKNELYALAFMEYLEGPDLFDTMFEKDPDGTLLLKIGGELLHHYAHQVTHSLDGEQLQVVTLGLTLHPLQSSLEAGKCFTSFFSKPWYKNNTVLYTHKQK
ncbi:hypothetical protein EVAR_56678_1 [Eumeta japonica]|uniref:Uncharacterized protein n=1 Tax=Eumeta variegata TaxID=151549 RepID=A0A4C1YX25_EUMVA|nr:hypothetical protein EVAR_56678_1 [Eumeta japonica]